MGSKVGQASEMIGMLQIGARAVLMAPEARDMTYMQAMVARIREIGVFNTRNTVPSMSEM